MHQGTSEVYLDPGPPATKSFTDTKLRFVNVIGPLLPYDCRACGPQGQGGTV